eukprot:COSAG02_NODE_5586_length_4209_cov_2.219951_5_plen_52_part_00
MYIEFRESYHMPETRGGDRGGCEDRRMGEMSDGFRDVHAFTGRIAVCPTVQ